MSDDGDSGLGTWVAGFIVLVITLLAASGFSWLAIRIIEHLGG